MEQLGYVCIKIEEYRDLIETAFYQEELIHENENLRKEIREIQELTLEVCINNYYLKEGTMEEVTDTKDYYFPYDKKFLEKINMPIKDVIEFIRLKKTDLLEKEKEENHDKLHYPDKPTKMQGYTKYAVLLLDFMVDEEKLENCTYSELMNPNGEHFPFDINRINQYGIDMDICNDYIVHRKNMIVARNEDNSLTEDEIDELLEEIRETEEGKEEEHERY